MQIIVKGKNLDITPQMHALAERKVGRLARHAPSIILIEVEFTTEHTRSAIDREIVRVNVELPRASFHAEERAADAHVALDTVVDKLLDQIDELHSRRRTKVRGRTPAERLVAEETVPTAEEYGAVPSPLPDEISSEHDGHPGTE
ncbi:MAG: ribosome-associated translation inhibitor RaiA [Chloroflexota bacterium]|nr:MAG: ribosome-associated translation inhibitor RaiA [Chloroflexota bacterium]